LTTLAEGLQRLPNHPLLLCAQGNIYRELKKNDKSRASYDQALRVALQKKNIKVVSLALHELLHVDGSEFVRTWTPQISQWPGLQASFWISQGEQAVACKLGNNWAKFFWDEAVRMVETVPNSGSPAAILLQVFEAAFHNELADLAQEYAKRLRSEYGNSGAVEFIDATYTFDKSPAKKKAVLSLLRKGKTLATQAKESTIVEMISHFEEFVQRPPLRNLFGGGMPGSIFDLLNNLDEEELDAFRKLF
jgi:hypothetical protein